MLMPASTIERRKTLFDAEVSFRQKHPNPRIHSFFSGVSKKAINETEPALDDFDQLRNVRGSIEDLVANGSIISSSDCNSPLLLRKQAEIKTGASARRTVFERKESAVADTEVCLRKFAMEYSARKRNTPTDKA
jgi:hypothetical protein